MTELKLSPLQMIWEGRDEFFRAISALKSLPLASCQETKGQIIYTSGIESACCNGIIEKDPSRKLSELDCKEAIHHFAIKKLPFIWWTADDFLETKGFQSGGILKGISVSLSGPLPEQPKDIKVRIARTDEELAHFAEIIGQCFGMEKIAYKYAIMSKAAMLAGHQIHFMAYADGKPVSTGSLSIGTRAAGFWNFGTLPEYRKKGIGKAVTLATLHEAKKRGFDSVMAYMMPKGLAWNLCQSLGFEEVSNEHFYVYGINPKNLEK